MKPTIGAPALAMMRTSLSGDTDAFGGNPQYDFVRGMVPRICSMASTSQCTSVLMRSGNFFASSSVTTCTSFLATPPVMRCGFEAGGDFAALTTCTDIIGIGRGIQAIDLTGVEGEADTMFFYRKSSSRRMRPLWRSPR